MMPVSGLQQKIRKQQQAKIGAKVDEKKSKDIMDSLLKDLDENEAEDLEEACKMVTG